MFTSATAITLVATGHMSQTFSITVKACFTNQLYYLHCFESIRSSQPLMDRAVVLISQLFTWNGLRRFSIKNNSDPTTLVHVINRQ